MALVNEHLLKLPENYFFPLMERKVNTYRVIHPHSDIIHLESGDASLPLPSSVTAAMNRAISELQHPGPFTKSIPRQGYDFLLESIIRHDYQPAGIHLEKPELFITDGIQANLADIADLLRHDNSIGMVSLSYPIYAAANTINGRAGEFQENSKWSNVIYIACPEENGFIPQIPDRRIDIVYLCNPHMPTGTALQKQELKKWVNYALENDTVIMYDATYEGYIQNTDYPHSIYEIKGARKVAIEYRNCFKPVGFAGLGCSYIVIPKELQAFTLSGNAISLNLLWKQHQYIKQNGISYITQRAAESNYSPKGKKEAKEQIQYYTNNTLFMKKALTRMHYQVYGGEHLPFLWIRIPGNLLSWPFFDKLLYEAQLVVMPGCAFGPDGDHYFRITGMVSESLCKEAIKRLEPFRPSSVQRNSRHTSH